MKKLLKPACFAFYFLMLLVFFILGMYVASWMEVGKNQGLAAAAIAMGWGISFGFIAFVVSIFLAWFLAPKIIARLNIVLLILLISVYSITHYRYLQRQSIERDDREDSIQNKSDKTLPTTAPGVLMRNAVTTDLMRTKPMGAKPLSHEVTLGIGFFSPNFYEFPVLYFYGGVNLEKALNEHTPTDSLIFTIIENYKISTSYAPPWLYPEHIKLDYELMLFKVLGIGHDFIKVEVNKATGQTAYLDKRKGKFKTWPEFLMSVNVVEFLENDQQRARIKPLEYASEINEDFVFMQPLLVEEEWMYVKLLNEHFKGQTKGWIRWRNADKLLIKFNLLS